MNDQNSIAFYPGKTQLLPIAFNIAISPMLLYLIGLWPWPPTMLHLAVFVVTTITAIRFLKSRLGKSRLVFDNAGIHCGVSYPSESISGVKPYMRALTIRINKDGKEKEKIINLWWASKDDIKKIYEIATTRYRLME